MFGKGFWRQVSAGSEGGWPRERERERKSMAGRRAREKGERGGRAVRGALKRRAKARTLVLHAPLELDDHRLAGELVKEGLGVDGHHLCGVCLGGGGCAGTSGSVLL
jgi:hypothetical protein